MDISSQDSWLLLRIILNPGPRTDEGLQVFDMALIRLTADYEFRRVRRAHESDS